MNQNKISIVIPTYNVAPYISRCIKSLKAQTVNTFEVVFVDDCGSDESIKIAEQYAKSNPNIKIIHHHQNQGTFVARRTGIENSTGEYIVFLDPDDELAPNTIELLIKSISLNPDLLLFNSISIPKPKPWKSKNKVPNLSVADNKNKSINKIIKCKKIHRGIAGKAAKRTIMLKAYNSLSLNNTRLVYGEDTLFFITLICQSRTFHSINSSLYLHYKNPTSITNRDQRSYVKNNIVRLNEIISIISGIDEEDPSSKKIKGFFIDQLSVLKLRLENITCENHKCVISNYIKIIKTNHSLKDLIRLSVLIVSFGKIHLN